MKVKQIKWDTPEDGMEIGDRQVLAYAKVLNGEFFVTKQDWEHFELTFSPFNISQGKEMWFNHQSIAHAQTKAQEVWESDMAEYLEEEPKPEPLKPWQMTADNLRETYSKYPGFLDYVRARWNHKSNEWARTRSFDGQYDPLTIQDASFFVTQLDAKWIRNWVRDMDQGFADYR